MTPDPERRPDDEDIDARFAEIVRHLRSPEGGQPGEVGRPAPRRPRWPGTGASPTDPPNPPPPGFQRPEQPNPPPPDFQRPQAPETDATEPEPSRPEPRRPEPRGPEPTGPGTTGPGATGPGTSGPGSPAEADYDGPDELNPATWREWVGPEVEEHFIPPDPPPLPAGDLHFWGIVVGLMCGPLILLLAHGFQVLHGSVWTWLGLLLSLGGFVLLVLRSPTDRHDDPSGGAQV